MFIEPNYYKAIRIKKMRHCEARLSPRSVRKGGSAAAIQDELWFISKFRQTEEKPSFWIASPSARNDALCLISSASFNQEKL